MRIATFRYAWALMLASTLCACGGGGGGGGESSVSPPPGTPQTPPPVTPQPSPLPELPATGNALLILSEPGDPVGDGRGKVLSYDPRTAEFTVTGTERLVQVKVLGDQPWIGEFQLPTSGGPLVPGTYANLTSRVNEANPNGTQSWGPEPVLRNCTSPTGFIKILDAGYSGGQLTRLNLEFEQRCTALTGSLKGRLRWDASDRTEPPAPPPPPDGLWRAPASSVPSAGNYVYLEGGTGKNLSSGANFLYTPENALIRLSAAGRNLRFLVDGDLHWIGAFSGISPRNQVQIGHYPYLLEEQRNNPAKGALKWYQPTTSCPDKLGSSINSSNIEGWVAVDALKYAGDRLQFIEMRFEQRCVHSPNSPALRGQVRWTAADDRLPPAPATVPAGLWTPPSSQLPTTGSYAYLTSEAGDWIGAGETTTLTPANHTFEVFESNGRIEVHIGGADGWHGIFEGPAFWGAPRAGYYPNLLKFTYGNPAKGGLSWSSPGRGCPSKGWFAIDSISYSHKVLRSLDLRFEHGCEGSAAVSRGKVNWVSNDPVLQAGRVDPVPAAPTRPPAPVPPARGSYILLEGGDDDYVGAGRRYLYTQANAQLKFLRNNRELSFWVNGDDRWSGQFLVPVNQTLKEGAVRFDRVASAAVEPDVAGLHWSGAGRGCTSVDRGSWSVEGLKWSGEQVLSADLAFVQYCAGAQSPLKGWIHWETPEPIKPDDPVYPPPADLWQLPESLRPASGTYLFLHSPSGAFIGDGQNRVLTPDNSSFKLQPYLTGFELQMQEGSRFWMLRALPIGSGPFKPGLYAGVLGSTDANPARGGFDFGGDSKACNSPQGWFVIDSISYAGSEPSAIEMRFEMSCEMRSMPVHGQLRWRR